MQWFQKFEKLEFHTEYKIFYKTLPGLSLDAINAFERISSTVHPFYFKKTLTNLLLKCFLAIF